MSDSGAISLKHYAIIFYNDSFAREFDIWLRYDIQLRKRVLEEDFDPGAIQETVHQGIKSQLTLLFCSGCQDPCYTQHSQSRCSMPPPSTWHNRPALSPHQLLAYPASQSSSTQGQSNLTVKVDARCFICGTLGHILRKCKEPKCSNGQQLLAIRMANGIIHIHGQSFCYTFNRTTSCTLNGCNPSPHICSLCSRSSHNAQSHLNWSPKGHSTAACQCLGIYPQVPRSFR